MPASVSLSLLPRNVLILLLFATEFRGILKRQASQNSWEIGNSIEENPAMKTTDC
jgi:hypothetical protein